MKLYDCFLFFNELDLLEIRLQELDKVIDKFVLCESRFSHNGSSKPLYYADNKSRFADFNHKIIHVIADDIVVPGNVIETENSQRNAIKRGITSIRFDDIILMGDMDEIPRASEIDKLRNGLLSSPEYSACFVMNIYYYFLNYQMYNSGWSGTVASFPWKYPTFQDIRNTRMFSGIEDTQRIRLENSGWHFSYVGSIENILLKLRTSSDHPGQTYIKEWVEDVVKNGGDIRCKTRGDRKLYVPVPYSNLPIYVQKNLNKFQHLLTKEPPNESLLKLFLR